MLPRLKLIEVLDGILRPLGEQEENHAEYGALDRLRRLWLDLQQKRIRANLDKLKYQIKGADYVSVVLDGQRLENCILCMIHLLLMRHMKVLRAARTKLVAVREFEDMLDSWNYVFEAFSQRLGVLVQTWRQQRLDLDSQVQYFSRGLFKGWFEREQSIFQMDYVNHFNAEDDDQYYASSEEEDMDGPDEDEIAVGLDPSGSADSERDSGVLTYPLPAAPEDESELISGDEQDWEPEAVRKHKADLELRAEVSSISKRLTNIEDILAQLLSALQQGSGVPSSPKPDKQRMSVAQREDIVQVRRTLELCKSAFIASRDGTGTAVEQHSTKILSEVLPSLVIRITEMAARYPGLGVLNTTLKAVVGLEMARRTNNRPLTFVAVWLCMADSIFQIMVIPPEAVDSDQDEFFKSIWGEVEKLSRTVRDFAMFCDVYDQQKIAARFFKAAASKDKLAAFANRFSGHTEALRTLLSSEFDTSLTKPVFSDLEVARNLTNMS
ncbi:hypothetical protein PsYK624_067750 [Phanerochaete sordida]|uniref:Uncharacterized protein n=1 Tax=Phanerochaete sordida TaxID=48140 RepID=A0A9P3G9F2_9APHY|nr:hypothetical protein PsYK624_067750 [Phanerochaete sordida]